jgi:hypothetical protein
VFCRLVGQLLPREAEIGISVDIRADIQATLNAFRGIGVADKVTEGTIRRLAVIDAE